MDDHHRKLRNSKNNENLYVDVNRVLLLWLSRKGGSSPKKYIRYFPSWEITPMQMSHFKWLDQGASLGKLWQNRFSNWERECLPHCDKRRICQKYDLNNHIQHKVRFQHVLSFLVFVFIFNVTSDCT